MTHIQASYWPNKVRLQRIGNLPQYFLGRSIEQSKLFVLGQEHQILIFLSFNSWPYMFPWEVIVAAFPDLILLKVDFVNHDEL